MEKVEAIFSWRNKVYQYACNAPCLLDSSHDANALWFPQMQWIVLRSVKCSNDKFSPTPNLDRCSAWIGFGQTSGAFCCSFVDEKVAKCCNEENTKRCSWCFLVFFKTPDGRILWARQHSRKAERLWHRISFLCVDWRISCCLSTSLQVDWQAVCSHCCQFCQQWMQGRGPKP